MHMYDIGILAAPVNFNVSAVNGTFLLTWEQPFSLENTGSETDRYIVYITSAYGNISMCVSMERFVVPKEILELCTEYAFSVSAVNGVGEGNASNTIIGVLPNGRLPTV